MGKKRKKGKILSAIEYYPALIVVWIVRLIPIKIAYKISSIAAILFYYLAIPGRRQAIQHIMHAGLAKDKKDAAGLAKKVFIHFGKVGVEFLKIDQYITPNNIANHITWRFDEGGEEILKKSKGIIMVGAHFGNWELSGLAYSILYHPILSIVNPFRNEKINNFIHSRRKNFRQETCEKKDAVKQSLRGLKAGRTIGILSDQHASKSSGGIVVNFFGRPAGTHSTAAFLHLRTGAPLFLGIVKRLDDNLHYEARVLGPFEVEKTGNMEEDVKNLTQKYTLALENEIRKSPEQWVWMHRRWLDINRKRKKFLFIKRFT